MKKNVGNMDKWIRWIAAVAMLGLYFSLIPANWSFSWLLLIGAGAALATGLVGFCGLYSLLGITTCQLKNSTEETQKP